MKQRPKRVPATVNGPETGEIPGFVVHAMDLKSDLIDFAEEPRFDRWREEFIDAALGDQADADDDRVSQTEVVTAIDDFLFTFRFPDGTALIDKFLKARPDLSPADREMLRGWLDPVDSVFEVKGRGEDKTEIVLFNLLDELTYRGYASAGPAAARTLRGMGFALLRLIPIADGAWFISGGAHAVPSGRGREAAQIAMRLYAEMPEAPFRNPAKVERGWEMQRKDRERFIEFFGSDEVVLTSAEALDRLTAYYVHVQESALAAQPGRAGKKIRSLGADPALARRSALSDLPDGWEEADTIGVVYDETDGMSCLTEYGMLRDLFGNPKLAADKAYVNVLRGYLNGDSIAASVITRLALAHPDTADEVIVRALKKRGFTWPEHGDSLLRKHKPWYYERPPLPKVNVIGDRVKALMR